MYNNYGKYVFNVLGIWLPYGNRLQDKYVIGVIRILRVIFEMSDHARRDVKPMPVPFLEMYVLYANINLQT